MQMAMGECSALAAYRWTLKVKLAACPMSYRPPGADRLSLRGPKVNSHMASCRI